MLAALVLSVAHLVRAYCQRGVARGSAAMIIKASLAPHFLLGNLLFGLVVPGLMLALHLAIEFGEGVLALAGVLLLAGNFLSKYAVIKAGSLAPVFVPERSRSSLLA